MQGWESLVYEAFAYGVAEPAGSNLQGTQATPGFARLSGGYKVKQGMSFSGFIN